ncbi:mucosa-associated lymphoid tissue lymphoma translocation protein 1 [Leptonychotes weddellii]|uniref:Mucosa-associated lymphoid tissue lymphoma translocation protein 1 n=1 Tax=Leptonychotes weddellii TaxID=9713 RepID=A0A7F8QWS0_LEPWE|nr:mucosa-associated lymphoid tissue lymphoma translocation protein 1 [Leptonychotes weddellii]
MIRNVDFIRSTIGIKITVNPESKAVLAGQFVKLCCRATGHPFVQYQWFKMNKEIPNGNASELIFNTVHVKDAGFYVCRVNNNFTFEFSQWSQLDVCDVTEVTESFQGSVDGISEPKLQICVEPRSQKLMLGSTLVLQCVAVGSPIPHYQWFKNESPLIHETKKLYMVPYVDLEHQGTYWCHVYNDRDSQDSKKVEIIIGRTDEAVECTEDELNNLGHPDSKEQTADQPLAKDKVALLIGNMNYWEHPKLKAPLVDVYELTNLLRQLDFKVVSLLDLTEYEMRNAVDEFLLLLDKGVYGKIFIIFNIFKRKQKLSLLFCPIKKNCPLLNRKLTKALLKGLFVSCSFCSFSELPESMCLKFQCGVQIQLGFAAEFSNVMIIYTSIVHKPPDVLMCDAYVTDFPLDLDIDPKDANKGTPEETGSYLVSKDLPKHCLYTRLSSLQKLKVNTFPVY